MRNLEYTALTPAANDNGAGDSTANTLLKDYRAARDAITRVDRTVNGLLDGQYSISSKAMLAAYTFTIACMDSPAAAAKLSGWGQAAVPSGANPFGQPLKLLVVDTNNIMQCKITMWAKVFRHAHANGIEPEQFPGHLKRNHCMRRWYDSIVAAERATSPKSANGGRKGGGKPKGGGNPTTGSPATGGDSTATPLPANVVQQATACGQLGLAFIDMEILLCNAAARAALESNPAYLGMVQAAHENCVGFANDNDPRFSDKGAASDDGAVSDETAASDDGAASYKEAA